MATLLRLPHPKLNTVFLQPSLSPSLTLPTALDIDSFLRIFNSHNPLQRQLAEYRERIRAQQPRMTQIEGHTDPRNTPIQVRRVLDTPQQPLALLDNHSVSSSSQPDEDIDREPSEPVGALSVPAKMAPDIGKRQAIQIRRAAYASDQAAPQTSNQEGIEVVTEELFARNALEAFLNQVTTTKRRKEQIEDRGKTS